MLFGGDDPPRRMDDSPSRRMDDYHDKRFVRALVVAPEARTHKVRPSAFEEEHLF